MHLDPGSVGDLCYDGAGATVLVFVVLTALILDVVDADRVEAVAEVGQVSEQLDAVVVYGELTARFLGEEEFDLVEESESGHGRVGGEVLEVLSVVKGAEGAVWLV